MDDNFKFENELYFLRDSFEQLFRSLDFYEYASYGVYSSARDKLIDLKNDEKIDISSSVIDEFIDDNLKTAIRNAVQGYLRNLAEKIRNSFEEYAYLVQSFENTNKLPKDYQVQLSRKAADLLDLFETDYTRELSDLISDTIDDVTFEFLSRYSNVLGDYNYEIKSIFNSMMERFTDLELPNFYRVFHDFKNGVEDFTEKFEQRLDNRKENKNVYATSLNDLIFEIEDIISDLQGFDTSKFNEPEFARTKELYEKILNAAPAALAEIEKIDDPDLKHAYCVGLLDKLKPTVERLDSLQDIAESRLKSRLRLEQEEQLEAERAKHDAEIRERAKNFNGVLTNGKDNPNSRDGASSENYYDMKHRIEELGSMKQILNNEELVMAIIAYNGDRHFFAAFIDLVNEAIERGTIDASDLEVFRSGKVADAIVHMNDTARVYGHRNAYTSEIWDKLNYLALIQDADSYAASFTRPEIVEAMVDGNYNQLTEWANSSHEPPKAGFDKVMRTLNEAGSSRIITEYNQRNRLNVKDYPQVPDFVEDTKTVVNAGTDVEEVLEEQLEEQVEVIENPVVVEEEALENPIVVEEEALENPIVGEVEELDTQVEGLESSLPAVVPQVEKLDTEVEKLESPLPAVIPQVEKLETQVEKLESPVILGGDTLETPAVVEQTGLVPVQPTIIVEQTGLTPVQPNTLEQNVITTPTGIEVIDTPRVNPQPKSQDEDVIDAPVVSGDEIEHDNKVETVQVLSEKTVKMRKVLASRKKKFNVRRDISVVAAAGLFGISLLGAGTLPLAAIAAGLAVTYAGKNVWQDIKVSVMRKVTDFKLEIIAARNGIEYEVDELGVPHFVMTEEQRRDVGSQVQAELNKAFGNEYRGLSNPRTIKELNYKGFSKVTIDDLGAAFEEFGGRSDDIPETVEIGPEEEEEVPKVNEDEVEELTAAEPARQSIIADVIQYSQETLPAVQTENTYGMDPELYSVGEQLLETSSVSCDNLTTASIQSVDQASVGMFNEMLDIFYNNKIQDDQQKTADCMTKFHTSMKNSINKLTGDIKKNFEVINKQTVLLTQKIMEMPEELRENAMARVQEVYNTKANIGGLLKPFDEEFDTLLNDVCSEYGIDSNSNAYNQLKDLVDKNKASIQYQLFNNLIQYSQSNSMAVGAMMQHFAFTQEFEEEATRKM